MSFAAWAPGLAILLVGLAVGLLAARRFARETGGEASERDLELKIEDLEARLEELYQRLRGERHADAGELSALEKAAARTLRELETSRELLGRRGPAAAPARKRGRDAAKPARASAPGGRSFVTGFLYGAGLFALLGALLYWALRDAQPKPPEAAPAPPVQSAGAPDEHPAGPQVPSEVVEQLRALDNFILANPENLEARRDMAYLLLSAGQLFDAFGQADQILRRRAEDPDALYIQSMVRLAMGNGEQAMSLLQRALAADPAHVDSLVAMGLFRLREGEYGPAIELWERGLEAVGGEHPELGRLLAMAREGRPIEEILGTGPEPGATEAGGPLQLPQTGDPEPEGGYQVVVGLSSGARPQPGGVLFVILTSAEGGPPSAVKRIADPRFPLELTLGPQDAMMGQPLPTSGVLTVRLDRDGNASTREPDELSASQAASEGSVVSLVLGG